MLATLRKYVLMNRSLGVWFAAGGALFTNGCDLAAGILQTVAFGLRAFS